MTAKMGALTEATTTGVLDEGGSNETEEFTYAFPAYPLLYATIVNVARYCCPGIATADMKTG
ncbi:MAG: hypothetical protein JRN52_00795 [Nitrososphaerota archaeon]|nr:hypothetical protein [Nitrososphaerota archaeon]